MASGNRPRSASAPASTMRPSVTSRAAATPRPAPARARRPAQWRWARAQSISTGCWSTAPVISRRPRAPWPRRRTGRCGTGTARGAHARSAVGHLLHERPQQAQRVALAVVGERVGRRHERRARARFALRPAIRRFLAARRRAGRAAPPRSGRSARVVPGLARVSPASRVLPHRAQRRTRRWDRRSPLGRARRSGAGPVVGRRVPRPVAAWIGVPERSALPGPDRRGSRRNLAPAVRGVLRAGAPASSGLAAFPSAAGLRPRRAEPLDRSARGAVDDRPPLPCGPPRRVVPPLPDVAVGADATRSPYRPSRLDPPRPGLSPNGLRPRRPSVPAGRRASPERCCVPAACRRGTAGGAAARVVLPPRAPEVDLPGARPS